MNTAAGNRFVSRTWGQIRSVFVTGPTAIANSLHTLSSSASVSNLGFDTRGVSDALSPKVLQQFIFPHRAVAGSAAAAYSTQSARGRGLWGQGLGLELSPKKNAMWDSGRQQQQVRQIMVDVVKDDLERAIRKLMRRLKEDGTIRVMRSRQYFQKPSELKVLAAKERDKRIQKKAFREKLKWIMERRSRGF
ncbi:hypothetical protein BDL97_04G075600 [Sphagnum fallax]|nr:hypothetical protein BDL97_04G075600 [Sphagnum fallax]